jgi:hypothetical protein
MITGLCNSRHLTITTMQNEGARRLMKSTEYLNSRSCDKINFPKTKTKARYI